MNIQDQDAVLIISGEYYEVIKFRLCAPDQLLSDPNEIHQIPLVVHQRDEIGVWVNTDEWYGEDESWEKVTARLLIPWKFVLALTILPSDKAKETAGFKIDRDDDAAS